MGDQLRKIDVRLATRSRLPTGASATVTARYPTLVWLLHGSASIVTDRGEAVFTRYSVAYRPPGTGISVRSETQGTWMGIVEFTGGEPPEIPLTREHTYEDIADAMLKHVLWLYEIRPDDWRDSIAQVLGYLIRIVESGAAGTRAHVKLPEPVKRGFVFVAEEWTGFPLRTLRLAEIAAAAGVTPSHLCRLFRDEFDMGPMALLRLLRLQAAADMLVQSDTPVRLLAAGCGFPSEFHFSAAFKKLAGVPPSRFRRAGRFVSFLPDNVYRLSSYLA